MSLKLFDKKTYLFKSIHVIQCLNIVKFQKLQYVNMFEAQFRYTIFAYIRIVQFIQIHELEI